MKIAEYQQMMNYLTGPRESFRKGGSVTTPKRGLVDEPGSYAGKEQYKNPKRALRRKNLYIQTYGQKSFDNLSKGDKSKVTSGDRNPLNVGQGKFKSFDPKFEPYRKEALKVFEKFKKSKKPFAPIDVAEKTIENMKRKKGAIKNINVAQFTQNLTRSFFTDEQREFFNIKDATLQRIIEKQTPKQTIFKNMIEGNSNIKSLMKATNLPKEEVERIIKNITNTDIPKAKKELALGKDVQNVVLRNFTVKDFDTFRKSLANEPTLEIVNKKAITELVTDAYRGQPKKLERALKRINAYFKIARKLNKAGLPLDLDHPLARSVIEDMSKVDPEQLIRISPLPQDINVGVKGNQFDRVYRDIINNLQVRNLSTEDRKKLLIQKKNLETLAKDLKIPFGKMSQRGRIINFGTPKILEKNFAKEIESGINFKTRFKKALDSFEPEVLTNKVMEAFGIPENKANDLITQFKTVAKEQNPQKYLNILKNILRIKKPGSIFRDLQADASGILDQISNTVFPPLQAAEVLPGEAKAATPKSTEFDLDMSLPKPPEPLKYLPDYGDAALAGYAAAGASKYMKKGDPLKKFRRFITAAPVRKGLGKLIQGAGTPLAGPIFAATNIYSKMKEGQSFADAVVDPLTGIELALPGLFKQNVSKITKNPTVQKALSLAIPFGKFARLTTPIGLALSAAGQAQEFYNQYQDLQKMKEQNPRAYSEFMSKRVAPALSDAEQTAIEDMGRSGAAGGGLLKQAGDRSGKPPEAGPTPQGLDFLMKRGR